MTTKKKFAGTKKPAEMKQMPAADRENVANPAASESATTKRVSKRSASNAVDKQLAKYREMRDFATTAEPRGGSKGRVAQEGALPFVIQKHAATRLHYDFRLGWRGVLKSWAVTKGPSYYPGDKRLAVQVEDHPMEYGGFEGTIPKGQYGGGTVMLWDHGTWEPQVDVDEGLRKGSLKFVLKGEKLKGKWALVRMGGRAANESKPNWLLIKEHDEFERGPDEKPITEEAPDSALTHRDLDAIAKDQDHVWNSKETHEVADPVEKSKRARMAVSMPNKASRGKDTKTATDRSARLKKAPPENLPEFIEPQLAIQAKEVPTGDEWIHELKLDGYRMQLRVERKADGKRAVRVYTRNGLDWTARMPDIARAAAELDVKAALLDGEVVVLTPTGGTSFAELQAAFQEHKRRELTYFTFDILHLDGHNLRNLPLVERKQILESLLDPLGNDGILRYSEHIRAGGSDLFRNACVLGAEGIVSKRASAPYSSARGASWVKVKCIRQQEFVIGGFTPPNKGGVGLGALLLGYYERGKLIYAGRTGTGFSQQLQRTLRKRLEGMRQQTAPFAPLPEDARKNAFWVRPELVAEVKFATWTSDNLLRQAAFQGLREDKDAKEVRRESPVDTDKIDTGSHHRSEPVRSANHRGATQAAAKSAVKSVAAPTRIDRAKPSSCLGGLRLTHPDKVLDEETKLTKVQLAAYYLAVAEHMLPHIANRPLSIVRCPEGTEKPCFFQKHVGLGLPAGIDSTPIRDRKGGPLEKYITLSTAEGLAGLAQLGALEVHPWGSRNDSLETPDMLIFDLDPDAEIAWETLTDAARVVRKLLKKVGLESFVKTTGGKGLHVVAPIDPDHEWPAIKDFARGIAYIVESSDPQLFLTKMTKAARKGKIYLDYQRNDRGATAVAPFSPRARRGMHVALPLSWNELADRPVFTVSDFDNWKGRLRRDPWAKMAELRQNLSDTIIREVSKELART
jgi:bifunctional non-homologous end joining protein LigD